MSPYNGSAFEGLCEKLGRTFGAISKSRDQSKETLNRLSRITDESVSLINGSVSTDMAIVLFGSLARREWTSGSDLDWTLLVDGPADPHHRAVAKEFARRAKDAGFEQPGPAGVFGNLSFSHDLIHCIGGEADSNANLTRRILMLLESHSLSSVDSHARVVRAILNRYLESERSYLAPTGRKYKVPRFLLNDIVRYWRTMAVDYASKQWDRGDEGWALRNVKLRFSRKLLFVSGLLTCFGCYLDPGMQRNDTLFRDQKEAAELVQRHLVGGLGRPPLDVLCAHLERYARKETAISILAAYDAFLARLDDGMVRSRLKSLKPEQAYTDTTFQELRDRSHEFQGGLDAMFHDDHGEVRDLMLKYGVF